MIYEAAKGMSPLFYEVKGTFRLRTTGIKQKLAWKGSGDSIPLPQNTGINCS